MKKDLTGRKDEWSPKTDLAGLTPGNLMISAALAKAVPISFSEEKKKHKWDSYKGGADIEYSVASAPSDAPEAIRGIVAGYNAWVGECVDRELNAAALRWDRYNASDPDSFIALTPRVGMKLMRSDTSVLSFVSFISCYNREYEPDDDLYYGHTFDARTGRKLNFNDFVTDTVIFSGLVCAALKAGNSGYPSRASDVFLDEGFKKRVEESLRGCRDDGHFAWAVSPAGFEIYISDPFYKSKYMVHEREHAFIPFSACNGILYQAAEPLYDYICAVPYGYIKAGFEASGPLEGKKEKGHYGAYLARISGERYLYLSGEDETLTYHVADHPEFIGSTKGEIYEKASSVFEKGIDPGKFTMNAGAYLVRELLQLRCEAGIGKEAVPVKTSLFVSPYNVEPMCVSVEFEAEVFSDDKDTVPEKKKLARGTWLNFLRTDAETFIDMEMEGGPEICRLYVTGNGDEGFKVNGYPAEEVLDLQGWLEE